MRKHRVRLDRLEKLAAFLSELERTKFDFSKEWDDCKSVGCAIGWTPVIFPKLVKRYPSAWHRFTMGGESMGYQHVGMKLFGLTIEESTNLFTPSPCHRYAKGLRLGRHAAPIDVAAHLRAFIAKCEEGEIQ